MSEEKKDFAVAFTYGGVVVVSAIDEEAAGNVVEEMTDDDLFAIAKNGLEIQSVEETE